MTDDDVDWLVRHVPHAVLWLECTLVVVWWVLVALAEAQR